MRVVLGGRPTPPPAAPTRTLPGGDDGRGPLTPCCCNNCVNDHTFPHLLWWVSSHAGTAHSGELLLEHRRDEGVPGERDLRGGGRYTVWEV